MNKIFEIATHVSTPLALGGFIAAAFFFVVRQILKKKIFPRLTKALGSEIIRLIIDRLFILALIAMLLGFLAYVLNAIKSSPVLPNEPTMQTTYAIGGRPYIQDVRFPGPPAAFRVDDYMNIFLNSKFIAVASNCIGYGDCTKPVPPVFFKAKPGDSITIEVYDRGGDYYFEELWIYKDGNAIQMLTLGKPSCSIAEWPCPTPAREPELFFRATYPVP